MPPKPAPPPSSILSPLSIVLASRVGLFILSYLGLALFTYGHNQTNAFPGNFFLDGWVRWDSFWYERIATQGYTNKSDDGTINGQRDTGNLPLFPLMIRAGAKLTGDPFVAGLLIANGCFIAMALLLWRLVEMKWGIEIAQRTLVLLCVYPFSYYFSAMYTESPFLLLAVAAFWFGEKRQWLLASLCAAGAGATRTVGSATAVALIAMYMQSIDWSWREVKIRAAISLLVGFCGLAAFVVFLAVRFHDPLAFITVHNANGWADFNSFQSFRETLQSWRGAHFGHFASGNVPLILTSHIVVMVIALALCVVGWFKLPVPYALWASLIVLVSFYRWGCFGRHFSTAFPAFIVGAMLLADKRLCHGIIYICTLLLALFTLLFTHSFWVA